MPTPFLLNGILASQISGHLYSGPAGAFDALGSVTVGSGGQSSITFSAIPQTYTHLQLCANYRGTASATANGTNMNFNSDLGSNYTLHRLIGDGSSASADGYTGRTGAWFGLEVDASATANIFAGAVVDILDYANTNKNKVTRSMGAYDLNGAGQINFASSAWLNTAAINSITIYPASSANFAQYSNFSLYGIR